MPKANAHALFCGLKEQPSYLNSLNVNLQAINQLQDAKIRIRQSLRLAFKSVNMDEARWEPSYRREFSIDWSKVAVEVKFMTQGSFAYKTLNRPARSTQEIDLDDGMYVPIRYLSNGSPSLLAKGLFDFVQKSLEPLCFEKGWSVEQKNSCVRVKINRSAHIDVPIYSVPLKEFMEIEESLSKNFSNSRIAMDHAVLKSRKIPNDKIMLANKDGNWVPSDPKKLHDWVIETKETYGPEFIRICRFLKGWRDSVWESSKFSSICIMRSVEIAFDKLEANWEKNRDDSLLYEVAKLLPEILSDKVDNPVVENASLNEWDINQKEAILAGVSKLISTLEQALHNADSCNGVITTLKAGLDERIPNCPDAVELEVGPVVAFKSSTIIKQAQPVVGVSKSG